MSYLDTIITDIERKNADQPEFLQAAKEVLDSLRPVVDSDGVYEKATYGKSGNYILGANIAGFKKVAHAMLDQGII
jgi:glutamate dehydrogenase/leucine dehydrogenase